MPHSCSATHSFPFATTLSTRERELAERAFGKQEERLRRDNESRGRQAEQLGEGVQRRLHNLLGTRRFAQLRGASSKSGSPSVTCCSPPKA